MRDAHDVPSRRKWLGRALGLVGIGLIVFAGLEYLGLMAYRAHREPVGWTTWLLAGSACLVVCLALERLRD